MKYSEFNREVSKMDFLVSYMETNVYIECDGTIIAKVSVTNENMFSNHYHEFRQLNLEHQERIVDICYLLSKTTLEDREEEKRYHVKLPGLTRNCNPIYLEKKQSSKDPTGIDWSSKDYILENPKSYVFTEKEIKEIDERYLAFKVEVVG